MKSNLTITTALFPAVLFLSCASYDKYMENGREAFRLSDYPGAVKYFTKAVLAGRGRDKWEQNLSYMSRAKAYMKAADYEKAAEDYRSAAGNGDNEARLELGRLYTETGDYGNALKSFDDYAGKAEPVMGIRALVCKGDVYIRQGETQKARAEYDAALGKYNRLIKNKLGSGNYLITGVTDRIFYESIKYAVKNYREYFGAEAKLDPFSILVIDGSFLSVKYFDNNTVRNWSDCIVLVPAGKHKLEIEKKYQYTDKMPELLREIAYGSRETPPPLAGEEDVQAVRFTYETAGRRVIVTALTGFNRDFIPLRIYRLSSSLEITDGLTVFSFSDISREEGLQPL